MRIQVVKVKWLKSIQVVAAKVRATSDYLNAVVSYTNYLRSKAHNKILAK